MKNRSKTRSGWDLSNSLNLFTEAKCTISESNGPCIRQKTPKQTTIYFSFLGIFSRKEFASFQTPHFNSQQSPKELKVHPSSIRCMDMLQVRKDSFT